MLGSQNDNCNNLDAFDWNLLNRKALENNKAPLSESPARIEAIQQVLKYDFTPN